MSKANPGFLTAWAEVERFLREWTVTYVHRPSLPLSAIDVETSLHNQARMEEPLREALVEQYADVLRGGKELPPIVVWNANNSITSGLMVVDGNHRRAAAAAAGRTAVEAFVIAHETPAAVITAMTMEANARHGAASSHADRVYHALHVMESGKNAVEAARMFGIKAADVRRAKALRDAERRAVRAGIDAKLWDALPSTSQTRLANIMTDEALAGAVQLAYDAGMSATDIDRMVNQLNGTRSAREQERILADLRGAYADQIGSRKAGDSTGEKGRARNTARQRWRLAIGQIRGLPPVEEVTSLLGPAERREFAGLLRAEVERLQGALVEVEKGLGTNADKAE